MRSGSLARLAIVLLAVSAAIYVAALALFREGRTIALWLAMDIAFVPLSVLLTTLVIDRLLAAREKQALLQKLNMVIGAFFSEVGHGLAERLTSFDPDAPSLRATLVPDAHWDAAGRARMEAAAMEAGARIDARRGDLEDLRPYLVERRAFMLRLLENPNLLEHEAFTDLLWAVFHLTEELASRRAPLDALTTADYAHLSGDMRRAYGLLLREWLAYMWHLKEAYPYLYSLAVRTNPFDPDARPELAD